MQASRLAACKEHHGRPEVGKLVAVDDGEQITAAGTAADVTVAIAEPGSRGEFIRPRGLGTLGEEERGLGDHENKHRT
jgi:hypothetical protein